MNRDKSGCILTLGYIILMFIIALFLTFKNEILNYIINNVWVIYLIISLILVITFYIIFKIKNNNLKKELEIYTNFLNETYKENERLLSENKQFKWRIEKLEKENEDLKDYKKYKKDYKWHKEQLKDLSHLYHKSCRENNELTENNKNLKSYIDGIDDMYKSGTFDELIHLYNVPVRFKNIKVNGALSNKSLFGYKELADIDILYKDGAHFDGKVVHQFRESYPEFILKFLHFDKTDLKQATFIQEKAKPGINVVNNITPDKFSEVVDKDGRHFTVCFKYEDLLNSAYRIHGLNSSINLKERRVK